MPFAKHKMSALVVVDPREAKKLLLAAFKRAQASRRDAAKILGCHEQTFVNWAETLGVREQLDRIEERALREGWHHGKNRAGRPKRKK